MISYDDTLAIMPNVNEKDLNPYLFIKNDKAKIDLAILFDTSKALGDVANVMTFGAKKYSRKNWSKVDDKQRYVSACMRHLAAYSNNEVIDPESNLPHLAHAITSLLFILELDRRTNGV